MGGATLVLHVFASLGQLWPTPMILVGLIVTLVTISVPVWKMKFVLIWRTGGVQEAVRGG